MDDRRLTGTGADAPQGAPACAESTALITPDGLVLVADQGVVLDVRGWPADLAAAAVDARKARLEAAAVAVTDLREPAALRRAREAFERAYERELYRREVEGMSWYRPAA
jgi:hypothetical protein